VLTFIGAVASDEPWLTSPGTTDLVDIKQDHDLAPWVSYLSFHRGDTGHGLSLAAALRDEPLQITPESVDRVCDIVINRLWLSRVEFRPDPEARAVGIELLEMQLALSPYRRSLLHYALGAEAIYRSPLRDITDLNDASEHLNRALVLGRTLGVPGFVSRCLALLAMLEVPRGNPVAGEELSRDALGLQDNQASGLFGERPAFWQVRALLVLQWSRYYQGKNIETDVVRICAERPNIWSDPIIATLLINVTALAALESGDVAAARRALGQAHVDRRIAGTGLWRVTKLMVKGYLAITNDDPVQTQRTIAELEELPALAEAALIRAAHLSHAGQIKEALATLATSTSGDLPSLALSYPTAAALEAVLYEELGQHDEADRSMARALGAAEQVNTLRMFAAHSPSVQLVLARRAAAAAPRSRWTATVLEYLEQYHQSPEDPTHRQPVRTEQTSGAPKPAIGGPESTRHADSPLTSRELEVLRLVNEGASHAQVAAELFVSLNTTKTHLRSIRRKLCVDRTGEAAAVARRAGWL
jgi:DNA-binding CsgD family transcriptional regulator/tetratricopeptide (TPR) repeat protein